MAKKNQSITELKVTEGIKCILSELSQFKDKNDHFFLEDKQVIFLLDESFNGFMIFHTPHTIEISGNLPAALITATLTLKEQLLAHKPEDVTQKFQFKTRFYKREIGFLNFENKCTNSSLAILANSSDTFLESYILEIVRRGFNALVLYCGYHPFEYFLDYKGFEQAAQKNTTKIRSINFNALKKLLSYAKKYGLKTFLHHYVSHFTQALADHLRLGLSSAKGRLAAFEHPEIIKYNSYIYERTLDTLPELDGFFFNFESIGNATSLLKRTIFQVTKKRKEKPTLWFRLWGVSDLKGMTEILNSYDGPKGLLHKSHETNDVYYYPSCDDRVKVWKKALPDVEFAFSVGPCHNCGTNINHKAWSDHHYINTLLQSILDKGADSVSFQSFNDL